MVAQDPTEHVNLKASEPALFESMRQKLLAEGKTLYQTNYAEPGTGPVKALGIGNPQGGGGSGKCISGPQVSPGHTRACTFVIIAPNLLACPGSAEGVLWGRPLRSTSRRMCTARRRNS